MTRRRAGSAVLIAAILALTVGTGIAAGSVGVAVDLGLIAIDQPLDRGMSYNLPTLGVRNPGTEPATYRMAIAPIAQKRAPTQSWFSFEPSEFTLAPGAKQVVAIRMAVPVDANPDAYESLLEAALVGQGQGAQVGAAAGARLTFTVRLSSGFEAVARQAIDLFERWLPWSVMVPGLVLLTVLLRWGGRRFRLRIERRQG